MQPSARLVVVKDYCTHAAGSDCTRCAAVCPHGAISLPDEAQPPSVDHSLCNGCGVCFGICDAFASTRNTMADLHARIRRIALTGERCYLTCRENIFPGFKPASNVVVLPCLSMLSPEFWAALLSENIRLTIACDLKYCEDCTRAGEIGGELFPRAVEVAELWTGGKVLFNFRIPEEQGLIDKYTDQHEASDRRAVFTDLAADVTEIASGRRRLKSSTLLQDFYERRERQRAAARLNFADSTRFADFKPGGRNRRVLFPKQQLLVEAVSNMPEAAERIAVGISATDSDLCCAQGACAESCPTGARHLDSKAKLPEIEPRLCIGCGICVDVCAQDACSVEESDARIYLDAAAQES